MFFGRLTRQAFERFLHKVLFSLRTFMGFFQRAQKQVTRWNHSDEGSGKAMLEDCISIKS